MERDLLMLRPRLTQPSSTTLLPQFTPLSAPQLSAPCHTQLPTQSQLSPLSPLSRLSLLSPLSTLMLVSTLSTPQSSTLLDPQSTTERERPRLIQLSSAPVSTLQSTLFTAPPLSTTPTQSPLST